MKTLSRQITASYLEKRSAATFDELTARWSTLMNDNVARKNLTAAHHMLYNVLQGRNWQRAFTKATNRVKLENGYAPNHSAELAVHTLHSVQMTKHLLEPFEGLVCEHMLATVRTLVPNSASYEPYNDLQVAVGLTV